MIAASVRCDIRARPDSIAPLAHGDMERVIGMNLGFFERLLATHFADSGVDHEAYRLAIRPPGADSRSGFPLLRSGRLDSDVRFGFRVAFHGRGLKARSALDLRSHHGTVLCGLRALAAWAIRTQFVHVV